MMMKQRPIAKLCLAVTNVESGFSIVEAHFQMFLETFDIILELVAFDAAQVFGADFEAGSLRGRPID